MFYVVYATKKIKHIKVITSYIVIARHYPGKKSRKSLYFLKEM